MKRRVLGWMVLSLANAAIVVAQPPGPREPRGAGPGGPRPPMPIIEALDKDGDHVISAEELKAATESLLTLDKNGDGKLNAEEFAPRPDRDGGPRDGGPRDGGPRDGGPRDGGPRDGRGAGPGFGGPRPGGPEGPRRGGPDGPPPAPSPERFVEHAMQFDGDGDGKLNRDELMKFAQSMPHHRQGPTPPGPLGDRRGDGDRPGSEPRRGDDRPDRPERPDRPARPDSE